MMSRTLFVATWGIVVASVGCSEDSLVPTSASALWYSDAPLISSEPALVRWEDELVGLDVRVQQNLLAIATVTNRSDLIQTVPAFVTSEGSDLNNFELVDSNGESLLLNATHADWLAEDVPFVELAPGRSFSEATDLLRAFPSPAPGEYSIRFHYAGMPGTRSTWLGSAAVPVIRLNVRRLVG